MTSKANEEFDKKIEDGIALLEQQKRVYEAEEHALRVLREEEVEDFERNENEKRKKRKQKGMVSYWCSNLFFIRSSYILNSKLIFVKFSNSKPPNIISFFFHSIILVIKLYKICLFFMWY